MRGDARTDRTIPVFEPSTAHRRRIEPGRPSPEHVAFVLLGVVLTFVVFFRGIGVL